MDAAVKGINRIYDIDKDKAVKLLCKPEKQMFYATCFDDKEMIEEIIKYSYKHPYDEKIQLSKFNLNIVSPLVLSCLGFAASNEMKKFIINDACQNCYELFWAGELEQIEKQTFDTWPKVLFYLLSLKSFNASYLFIF
jgi:hypothetical protein